MNNVIKTLSIRGRVFYLIMCFETFVSHKYPDRNWKPVCDLMWKICDESDFIDNSAYRYIEIIPEYLYEFDNYKDADFDYLSVDEYEMFMSIIPKDDPSLNTIMHSIYDVTMEYAYSAVPDFAPYTLRYIKKTEKVMMENGLPLPDVSVLSQYTDFEHWWGFACDGRYLSIILK